MELPNRKVGSAGATGAVVVLLTFLCESLGWEVPDTVWVAVTTLLMFGVGYLVPLAEGDPGRHAKP